MHRYVNRKRNVHNPIPDTAWGIQPRSTQFGRGLGGTWHLRKKSVIPTHNHPYIACNLLVMRTCYSCVMIRAEMKWLTSLVVYVVHVRTIYFVNHIPRL